MLKKINLAIISGCVAYLALTQIPFFPEHWIISFSLAAAVLYIFQPQLTLFFIFIAFSLSVAYHSYSLFFLLLLIWYIFEKLLRELSRYPEMVLLVFATPLLTNLQSLGLPPLEYLAIFIAPTLLTRRNVPITATLACIWCFIIGIISQKTMMGNLIIGNPEYLFFQFKEMGEPFHELGWMITDLRPNIITQILIVLFNSVKFVFARPVILLQILGWTLASHVIAHFFYFRITKEKWWLSVIGVLSAAAILIALQIITLIIIKESVAFDLSTYLITVTLSAAVFLFIWELSNYLETRGLAAKIRPSSDYVQSVLSREKLRHNSLSNRETQDLQAAFRDYIQHKFLDRATVLDISLVDSDKLSLTKAGLALTEFWKTLDLNVVSKKGRLFSRISDGAIYIFGDANQALWVAKAAVLESVALNKKWPSLNFAFRVRSGLFTGEIRSMSPEKDPEQIAHILEIAEKLQKSARPGEILIAESTYQQLLLKDGIASRGTHADCRIPFYSM